MILKIAGFSDWATALPQSPDGDVMNARIVVASFIGTAIEFYDFYVYATAAALVLGPTFFPASSQSAQLLSAFATFAIAFIARPFGSAIFGHFGDRSGRKATLVASPSHHGCLYDIDRFPAWLFANRVLGAAFFAFFASGRASASAANGAVRRCWRSRTRPPPAAPGSGCSRSLARLWVL